MPGHHITIAQPIVQVNAGDATSGYTTALAVEIPLMALALATVALRVYSRLAIKRSLAADDILIMLGTAAGIARTVISCMSAEDNWGYDRKGPDHATEVPYYQHIFERRIAYLLAVTFTRFSILAYYLRIFPQGMYSLRRCCYILIALAAMLFIEVFVVLIVYCKDIGILWTADWLDFTGSQCFSSAVYSYSAAIGDSVIDSMIFALPAPYVWRLSKLRARQRLGLVLIFGLGFVVCVVALLQIPFIRKREGSTTYFGTTVNILVAVQVSFAIIAASLPDLRALMARNFSKFSPLHHRSMATAGRAEAYDEERNRQGEDAQDDARVAFEGKRGFRKPDWLRNSIPTSLMSTRVTQSEVAQLSKMGTSEVVPQLPRVPEQIPVGKDTYEAAEHCVHHIPNITQTVVSCFHRTWHSHRPPTKDIQQIHISRLQHPRALNRRITRDTYSLLFKKLDAAAQRALHDITHNSSYLHTSRSGAHQPFILVSMASTYDFIIVGGGTAGCLLARHLATSHTSPRILLLEAGSNPSGLYLRAPFHRYLPAMLRPDLDFGYVSEPEPELNNRTITYNRGKGLGGSSILNFGVYLYGSEGDYERWAELVGDKEWGWDSVRESFHSMEEYDYVGASSGYKHLADPSTSSHGRHGKLKVGLPPVLEKGAAPHIEAMVEAGEKLNLDLNSGDPVGVGVFPYSYSKEGRSTSAHAHLKDIPENLEVWTGAVVERLRWEGKRIVGVDIADGRKALASKEVILCGGALDTPRLLLLNGIGPKSELEALDIDVKVDLPGVGKHLQDHLLIFMSVEIDGSQNDRYKFESNPKLVAEAQELWDKDQSGAFAHHQSTLWGGFLKLPNLEQIPEFQQLPPDDRKFLTRPSIPTYEMVGNGLRWPPNVEIEEGNSYMTLIAFLMNPQSEGSVTLRSKDANDSPIIKLNYLTHPYDRVVFREAMRNTWQMTMENPKIKPFVKKTLSGPASMSDADIDKFANEQAGTVWHANGTVKMGKEGEKGSCVDTGGKVYGVQGLRVADLSVCPLTTNNHTQSTAYLVGRKIGEKIVAEYRLNGRAKL
ncbi:hypothetical protein DE146DRAFT_615996 [Phaeosphaeria sp. MPI-PUGE-AT-0046c]|nr:hypothetical protein DE146DRAFT_615996 [Phaeosphaeria sp. MPI-PUGE-AT-0046c]